MSILKLTEENINDRVFIKAEDDFSCEGTLVALSDTYYEIKDDSSHLNRIYEFEIVEISILNSKSKPKINQSDKNVLTEEYKHPLFGTLKKSKGELEFHEITSQNLVDINKNSSDVSKCRFIYINKSCNMFETVMRYLGQSKILGLSYYIFKEMNIKFLNISDGFITTVIYLEHQNENWKLYKDIINLLSDTDRLFLTCGGGNLVEFVQSEFDIRLINFIDLQIFHFGLHNLRLAEVLPAPIYYSKLVHTIFGIQFQLKSNSRDNISLDLIIKKMAFNSHFLIHIYHKFIERLLDPVKSLSRKLCVPMLDSDKLIGDSGRPSIDFDKLPRSVQFWGYTDSVDHYDNIVNGGSFIRRGKTSNKCAGMTTVAEEIAELQRGESVVDPAKMWRELANLRDEEGGRTDRGGYVEEISSDEEEKWQLGAGKKWLSELKKNRQFNGDINCDELSDEDVNHSVNNMKNEEREQQNNFLESLKKVNNVDEVKQNNWANTSVTNSKLLNSRKVGIGRGRGRRGKTPPNKQCKPGSEDDVIILSSSSSVSKDDGDNKVNLAQSSSLKGWGRGCDGGRLKRRSLNERGKNPWGREVVGNNGSQSSDDRDSMFLGRDGDNDDDKSSTSISSGRCGESTLNNKERGVEKAEHFCEYRFTGTRSNVTTTGGNLRRTPVNSHRELWSQQNKLNESGNRGIYWNHLGLGKPNEKEIQYDQDRITDDLYREFGLK